MDNALPPASREVTPATLAAAGSASPPALRDTLRRPWRQLRRHPRLAAALMALRRAHHPATWRAQWRRLCSGDTSESFEFSLLYPLLQHYPAPWVVDVGANDGYACSNSYPFIRRGFRALLIEPNPVAAERCRALHAARPGVRVCNVAASDRAGVGLLFADKRGFEGQSFSASLSTDRNAWTDSAFDRDQSIAVPLQRLDALLYEADVPVQFALLSVDTEGHDLAVLGSLGRYRPAIIITERYAWNLQNAIDKQRLLSTLDYYQFTRVGRNEVYLNIRDPHFESRIAHVARM